MDKRLNNKNVFSFRWLAMLLLMAVASAEASMPKEWPFFQQTVNGVVINVCFLTRDVIRVMKYPEGVQPERSEALMTVPQEDVWVYSNYTDTLIDMGVNRLGCQLDLRTGRLSFYDDSDKRLLAETGQPTLERHKSGGNTGKYKISQSWTLDENETLYNTLVSTNVPYFTSVKGYGILWDNRGATHMENKSSKVSFSSEAGTCVDYYFVYNNGTMYGLLSSMHRVVKREDCSPWINDVRASWEELKKRMPWIYRRLQPYFYSMADERAHYNGLMMRPLVVDFTQDEKARHFDDEYMFGHALLVKTSKTAHVYLPAGTTFNLPGKRHGGVPTKWYDFFSNRVYAGGQQVRVTCPGNETPLYVRAGSILPYGSGADKPWDNLEIRIYPGADGRFMLYEDDSNDFNLTDRSYTKINFYWDDAARTLTISGRDGSYRGMLKKRQFRIVVVGQVSGCGHLPMIGGRVVEYRGKKMEVSF